MSRRTGLFWDAIAGRRPIPRAAASLVAPAHVVVPLFTPATPRPAPRAACDHGSPAGWQLQSTHRTSEGTVAYARCPCGASLVLLDGQPLAAVGHPRPRAATPPVPGERPLGRGRGRWRLWDRGQGLWKWKGRQRQRADPR
jgi:hypothetical protein